MFAASWHNAVMTKPLLAALALFAAAPPAFADSPAPSPTEQQFAQIAAWEGRWTVAETDALEIVFEITARGKTVVERWETATGLHSMTVYHLDDDTVVATHYCPQGNQPRLETVAGDAGTISFRFRDITDLDPGEAHTQTLVFAPQADGSLKRTEVYLGDDGPQAPGTYTLIKAP